MDKLAKAGKTFSRCWKFLSRKEQSPRRSLRSKARRTKPQNETRDNPQTISFFDLPREIRDQIYHCYWSTNPTIVAPPTSVDWLQLHLNYEQTPRSTAEDSYKNLWNEAKRFPSSLLASKQLLYEASEQHARRAEWFWDINLQLRRDKDMLYIFSLNVATWRNLLSQACANGDGDLPHSTSPHALWIKFGMSRGLWSLMSPSSTTIVIPHLAGPMRHMTLYVHGVSAISDSYYVSDHLKAFAIALAGNQRRSVNAQKIQRLRIAGCAYAERGSAPANVESVAQELAKLFAEVDVPLLEFEVFVERKLQRVRMLWLLNGSGMNGDVKVQLKGEETYNYIVESWMIDSQSFWDS